MSISKIQSLVSITALLLLMVAVAQAAPPKNPDYLRLKQANFRPCRVITDQMRESLQKRGTLRMFGQRGVIGPTTKKVLVIRVQFTGGPLISLTKTQSESFVNDVRTYFLENSYGLFTASFTVTSNVYTLYPIKYYNDETDDALTRLVDAAVSAANSDVNFSQYDYVMIYHAGMGEEVSRDTEDIWSMFVGMSFNVDGKDFDGFTVVPELAGADSSSLGVICHEFGHQLGLPDLYNTSVTGGVSTCGAWSLMDYPYGYDSTGKNPPHLDPWCKNYLKFIDLNSRTVTTTIPSAAMGDIESSQTTGYYKLPVDYSDGTEYFIVENRTPDPLKTKYDQSLPGSGILIWHIDDAIASNPRRIDSINTGNPHRGIDLVEADGTENFTPPGRASNAFGRSDIFVSPLSDSFDGLITDLTLSNISFSGDSASGAIRKIASTPALTVSRMVNYPNPAGKGYFHPRQGNGTLTTVFFQTTRPPRDIALTIYDITGNIVRTANRYQFLLNLTPTNDYKWVFEYDWNGKNENGDDVASGIYLYRIKADKETKIGKIAIVR